MKELFSIKLKQLRTEKDLTQPELAKIIGYSNSIISDWENNKAKPTSTAIITLANFFNVTTDYLLGLENEDGTKIKDTTEQEEYIPIVARSKDNKQRNLTISKSELKKIIAEAIEYTNKNKDN